ncbi:MAG: DUF2029 domain-containing protein [Saprospiraceae bacterium]
MRYLRPVSPISEKIIRYAVSLAFAGLTVFLGYFVKRSDFVPFIAAYGAFFGIYVWLVFFRKNKSEAEIRWFVGLGIALRVMLLFSVPNLSDDFYRFLWDGYLTAAGFHPFAHPPIYFIENQVFPKGITPGLFGKLNSPEYFTVYPPVCQAVFALAAWTGGGVFVIKVFLLICEIGTIRLLCARVNPTPDPSPDGRGDVEYAATKSRTPLPSGEGSGVGLTRAAIAYALNPLVILEIAGNCHFEGVMIFFLIAGLRALEQNEVNQSAVWWALATASKLLPLMFLPIVWRWLGWRKGLIFNAVFAGICLVLFMPLLPVLPNILSSLDLYFQKFQFNASFYYLFREVGFWRKGYDTGEILGPLLGLATVVGVFFIAWNAKPSKFSKLGRFTLSDYLLFALMLQLSLSATVHPWYAAVPFAVSLLTRWRFPMVWTGLVALSYSHYAGGLFRENYWLIALEYGVLWLFIFWETREY